MNVSAFEVARAVIDVVTAQFLLTLMSQTQRHSASSADRSPIIKAR
jgi:hypothetical protein